MAWSFTDKVVYAAWKLGVTPRTVYRRVRKPQDHPHYLDLDSIAYPDHFPAHLLPSRGILQAGPDSPPDGNGTSRDTHQEAIGDMAGQVSGHPDAAAAIVPTALVSPALIEPILAELRRAQEEAAERRELAAELRERLRWITAERDLLSRKVQLLEAPKEPAADPDIRTPDPDRPDTSKPALLLDRIRSAWYVLANRQAPRVEA